MARWGLRVIVSLAALVVPVNALALGIGPRYSRWGGRGPIGYTSAPKFNAKPVKTIGRRVPWPPPPFVVGAQQFMQCGGRTIAAGAQPQAVRRACGEPSRTRHNAPSIFTANQTVEIWSYVRRNSIVRNLRFENGVLTSIDTVHPSKH